MSKSFILTILIIVSGMSIFLIYYSYHNSPTPNIDLVEEEKLPQIDYVPQVNTQTTPFLKSQAEPPQNPVQNVLSEKDKDKLDENETTLPIQDVIDILRGQEDENGVRHDINVWISEQNLNLEQKLALTQVARSLQNDLVRSEQIKKLDRETARKEAQILAVELLRSSDCIYKKFNNEPDPYKYSDMVRELTLNTNDRIAADKFIDQALNGGVVVYPKGETCEN